MKSKTQYLFVCVENACRSQMAEGFFNALTDKSVAKSAGTESFGTINPMAIKVMRDKVIDISKQGTTVLTPELVKRSKKVITMGCIDNCPFTPPEKTIKWNIPDPKEKSKRYFIEVRDLIEEKTKQLLKDENLIF